MNHARMISLHVPAEMLAAIEQRAELEDRSRSSVIREALRRDGLDVPLERASERRVLVGQAPEASQ